MDNTYKTVYPMEAKIGCTIVEIPATDAVALAAAWGLMATPRILETYKITKHSVLFRMQNKTYKEFLDILECVKDL